MASEAHVNPIAEQTLLAQLRTAPSAERWTQLAWLLIRQQRLGEARQACAAALACKPKQADLCNQLGTAFAALEAWDEAAQCYTAAIRVQPRHASAHFNLGLVRRRQARYELALNSFRRSIELRPGYAAAHYEAGMCLLYLERDDEAERACNKALQLEPAHFETLHALANLHMDHGRDEQALDLLQRARALQPDNLLVLRDLAVVNLRCGRFDEGWSYMAQADVDKRLPFALPVPRWQQQDLRGRTVLLICDDGFGDQINFLRFVPRLREAGAARVDLACRASMRALLEDSRIADAVLTLDEGLAAGRWDCWEWLGRLPARLVRTLADLSAAKPYLHVSAERRARWQPRMNDGPRKVGLVWRGNPLYGNDERRSLHEFSRLAALWSADASICFYTLQFGVAAPATGGARLHDLGPDIGDLADTAAIIEQLDLLISVDTSAAHIAGALGTPVWTLLPSRKTDWRWLREREDTPWYPSMRLLRQGLNESWEAVMQRVADDLKRWADTPPQARLN